VKVKFLKQIFNIIFLMSNRNNFFIVFFVLLLFSNLYFIFQNQKQQKIIDELKKETVEQRQIVNKNEIIAKVERVIDGDTIVLEGKRKIRLANINAPELEYCLGKGAKERVEQLILGKEVRVIVGTTGNFGRELGFVYLGELLVNQLLLQEGWGRYDSTHLDKEKDKILLEAAHRAEREKIGVYRICTQTTPPNLKCSIKGNIDKKLGKKIYHFPGCAVYQMVSVELDRGERWFCSEEEAKNAGFTKSQQCYGKEYKQ
jgi:endonuclease YncB( thermonuclease family)